MITKTCSEIIHNALDLAQVQNSDFRQWNTSVDYLNTIYRELYNNLTGTADGYYIKEFRAQGPKITIPDDLQNIHTIYRVEGFSKRAILRCPSSQEGTPNTYETKNDEIIIFDNGQCNEYIIEYVPNPQTLTMPRESLVIDLDPNTIKEIGKMTQEYFYYKDAEDNGRKYYFFSKENKEATFVEQDNSKYLGLDFVFDKQQQTVTLNEDDITAAFVKTDVNGENIAITSIILNSPWLVVNYEDNTIAVMNNLTLVEWNNKITTGHETLGKAFAINTNDRTGYGIIFLDYDDEKLYLSSFVPDTVMNYPNNALFALIEVELATLFSGLVGAQNPYVTDQLLPARRQAFADAVHRDEFMPTRARNVAARSYFMGGATKKNSSSSSSKSESKSTTKSESKKVKTEIKTANKEQKAKNKANKDSDGDGKVSKSEKTNYKAAEKENKATTQAKYSAENGVRYDGETKDRNGDGKEGIIEKIGNATSNAITYTKNKKEEKKENDIAKNDRDGDGKVSFDERVLGIGSSIAKGVKDFVADPVGQTAKAIDKMIITPSEIHKGATTMWDEVFGSNTKNNKFNTAVQNAAQVADWAVNPVAKGADLAADWIQTKDTKGAFDNFKANQATINKEKEKNGEAQRKQYTNQSESQSSTPQQPQMYNPSKILGYGPDQEMTFAEYQEWLKQYQNNSQNNTSTTNSGFEAPKQNTSVGIARTNSEYSDARLKNIVMSPYAQDYMVQSAVKIANAINSQIYKNDTMKKVIMLNMMANGIHR